jgi:hypothetical protein
MSDFKDEPPALKSDTPISSLRDRIEYALFDACCRFDVPASERRDMADAVIAELGLREEREDVASFQSTGEMDDSVIPPRPKSRLIWTPSHRYVTEWTADE